MGVIIYSAGQRLALVWLKTMHAVLPQNIHFVNYRYVASDNLLKFDQKISFANNLPESSRI